MADSLNEQGLREISRPYGRFWRATVLVTVPVWGTIAFVAFLRMLPRTSDVPEYLPLALALIGPAVGAIPIFGAKSFPFLVKLLFAVVYYIGALVTIFIVGWGAFCAFDPTCH